MEALSAEAGIPASALVEVRKGGNSRGGTLIHPDIGIHLAQWLDPHFAVAVSRWIRELLTTGRVELYPPPMPSPLEIAQAISVAIVPAIGQALSEGFAQQTKILIASLERPGRQRILDLVDPREHIRRRWPGIKERIVGNVIRRMDKLHRLNLGRPCPQLGLDEKSPLMIERENLWLLDRAFEFYREKHLPPEQGPLFRQAARAN